MSLFGALSFTKIGFILENHLPNVGCSNIESLKSLPTPIYMYLYTPMGVRRDGT